MNVDEENISRESNYEKLESQNGEVVINLNEKPSRKTTRKKDSIEISVENDAYKCNECNFSSEKRLNVKKHYLLEHSDKPFKCEFCEKAFRDPSQLNNHKNVHLGLKPFRCETCQQTFTTRGELTRHVRYKHTLERPHKCSICDYSSVELSKLKRHMRVHTGERPYLCPYCDYASRDTFKLKRHLRTHTGEKPYECPICKNCFSQSNSLKIHMNTHHSSEEKASILVDLNETLLDQNSSTSQHEVSLNTSLKLPITPIDTTSTLNSNIPTPSSMSETNLESSISEETNESTATSATKTSSDETKDDQQQQQKLFECVECGMRFLSNHLLNEHFVRHTGERPFKCEKCGVGFGQKFALRAHLLSHDLEYSEKLKTKLKSINETTAIATSIYALENALMNKTSETSPTTEDLIKQSGEKVARKRGRKKMAKSVEIISEQENVDQEKKDAEKTLKEQQSKLGSNVNEKVNRATFFCENCHRKFVSENNLRRHLKNFHKIEEEKLIEQQRDNLVLHLNATVYSDTTNSVNSHSFDDYSNIENVLKKENELNFNSETNKTENSSLFMNESKLKRQLSGSSLNDSKTQNSKKSKIIITQLNNPQIQQNNPSQNSLQLQPNPALNL